MDKRSGSDFSKGSIAGNILRLAIPITLAEFVHVLYNIVDRMFIGHIPEVGTAALSGVGVAFPLITLSAAFSNLCRTGGSPLFSIERGKGESERARRIMENTFTLIILFSAVLVVVFLLFGKDLLAVLGGDEETLPYAAGYFGIYTLGIPFSLISLSMNSFINAQGFGRIGMLTVIIGAALNTALDPIFIFTLGLGVRGAAIATVISQFVSALWVIGFLCGKRVLIRLTGLHLDADIVKRILKLGVTGFMFRFSNSVAQSVVNMTLRLFGGASGTLYIGAMSVINSVREIISMPVSGTTEGATPVIGYNYGAKLYDRVCKAIKFMMTSCLAFTTLSWAVIHLFPEALFGIFTDDAALIATTVSCAHVYYAVHFLMALQMGGQNTFIALNLPKRALTFSILRKFVLIVPLTLILPRVGLGVMGVFWAEAASQMIGATSCFLTMYFTVYRKLKAGRDIAKA